MQARNSGRWLVGFFGVLAVLGAAGEAAAQPEEVEGTCSNYQVSPTSATVAPAGDSGTFDITWDWEAPDPGGICFINCTEASCSDPGFIVRSSAAWLSGTNRNGVRVDYTAQAHTGTASRSATLTVANATFTVTQHPPGPCPSSPDRVSPTSTSFPAVTSVRYVSVTGRSDCSWSVSADQGWLTTTPSSVSGGGSVRIQAGENPGGAREGTVAIGGSSVSVSQASGCPTAPTTVSPSSLTFPAAGGTAEPVGDGPGRLQLVGERRPGLDHRHADERGDRRKRDGDGAVGPRGGVGHGDHREPGHPRQCHPDGLSEGRRTA